MIIASFHDGERFDEALINTNGFLINASKDVKKVSIYDPITGEKKIKVKQCMILLALFQIKTMI